MPLRCEVGWLVGWLGGLQWMAGLAASKSIKLAGKFSPRKSEEDVA